MDKILSNTDFADLTKEYQNEIMDKLRDFNDCDIDEISIIATMKELGDKIKKFHPIRKSDGYSLFYRFWNKLKHLIKSNMNSDIQNSLMCLIDSAVESGWTATNTDLLIDFAKLIPTHYFKSMDHGKLEQHFEKLKTIDFKTSYDDAPDNERYTQNHKETFVRIMYFDGIEDSLLKSSKDLLQDLLKHFYLQSWSSHSEVVKTAESVIAIIERKVKKIYVESPEKFLEHFKEISEKLLTEEVVSDQGKKLLENFYRTYYIIMRESKAGVELVMYDWCHFLFQLYKLERDWLIPIIDRLVNEVRVLDSKFVKTAFLNCGSLIGEATEFLSWYLDRVPKVADEEENNSREFETKKELWEQMCKTITTKFYPHTIKTADQFETIIPCLLKFVRLHTKVSNDMFSNCLHDMNKTITGIVKTKPEILNSFIITFADFAIEHGKTENQDEEFPFEMSIRRLDDNYDKIEQAAKQSKAFNSPIVQETLFKCIIKALNEYSLSSCCFIEAFGEYIIFKNLSVENSIELVSSFNKAISSPLIDIFNPKANKMGQILKAFMDVIAKSPDKYKVAIDDIKDMVCVLLPKEMTVEYDGSDYDTVPCLLLVHVFSTILTQKTNDEIVVKFYPYILEVAPKVIENNRISGSLINSVPTPPNNMASPSLLQPYLVPLVDLAISFKDTDKRYMISTYFSAIKEICGNDPLELQDKMDDIIQLLIDVQEDYSVFMSICQVLVIAYKSDSIKCTTELLDVMFDKLNRNQGLAYQGVAYLASQVLQSISNTDITVLVLYLDKFCNGLRNHGIMVATAITKILLDILKVDKSKGEEIFSELVQIIDANIDNTIFAMSLLNGLRMCGVVRHDLLVALKEKVEKWQLANTALHDVCQHLFDVIADHSLAGLDEDLSLQKAAMGEIGSRVEQQETRVEEIGKDVEKHEVEIGAVNERVDQTNERVDVVVKNVEELDDQVQEIDLKTVSNAPKWAREVSLLLNPESEADWKLLGARLGYSNDNIRAWSTHTDPCMSLLSEWFAVRRNVESTRAILEQLTEMNRLDAAAIVERALTAAEAVVTDDEPMEFIEPPLIFLSYQWAVQEEIKFLKYHLQKAGYRCWMDIGQMGGGDKLYEAIDRGIRSAKVFIACVSSKYPESANCKRELNLAISLKKSVIPLQMERMSWPPPGTMGPLLTEYIFIRMFGKPGAELTPGTFWPADRFKELLMQIRYSCAPEYEIVDEDYANWWLSSGEVVQYHLKVTQKESTIAPTNATTDATSQPMSPEIFISYQWGKQTEIQALYYLLTSLKFTCWMDIHQMGGGDSLYDKIDRGVRGCVVVVSGVTPKYSESPNCRREVSLADSLKKPIIPILLEHMQWPPEGPMSMAMTQLSPMSLIDEQQKWEGPATETLIQQLSNIMPEGHPSKMIDQKKSDEKSKITPESKKEEQRKNSKINNNPVLSTKSKNLPSISKPRKSSLKIDKMNKATHVKSSKSNHQVPPTESKSYSII